MQDYGNQAAVNAPPPQSLTESIVDRLGYIRETLQDSNSRMNACKERTFGAYPEPSVTDKASRLTSAPNGRAEEIDSMLSALTELVNVNQSLAGELMRRV